MPKPTAAALAKHPRAVVILSAFADEPELRELDFEWFDNESAVAKYLDESRQWADEVCQTEGDMIHVIASLTDTISPPTIGEITVHTPGTEEAIKAGDVLRQQVIEDTTLLVQPTAPKTSKAAKPKVKPKVKGRAASPAAAAIKAAIEEEPKKRRRPAKDAEAVPSPRATAALKARLAAKKAAAADAPEPEPEAEPMGMATPLAIRRLRARKEARKAG